MPAQGDPHGRRFRVLVVDDEGDSLLEIRDMLAEDPRLVIVGAHSDPQDALDALQALGDQPEMDFAFIDIRMPAINGFELGERLMARYPELLIVYVTAYNDYATEAFDIDAVDYILKPVRKERLQKAVDRLVARAQVTGPVGASGRDDGGARVHAGRLADAPPQVRVQCFGRLELLVDGSPVRWPTKKSMELFAYLLHNKEKFVSKDRIVDNLWPDQGYENALVNLHTAIYRIRQTLGESGGRLSIDYESGRYRLRMADVSFDVEEFEKALDQSRSLPDKAIALLEHATSLYTGDYLEEPSYIWCVDVQEGLRQKRFACLRNLATLYVSAGDPVKAVPILETAVANNPYDSAAVDLLFRAYRLSKDAGSMVAFYEKARVRHANGLGEGGLRLLEERFFESYREITGERFR